MDFKRLGKALLFPNAVIMAALVPISAVLLIGSMVFLGSYHPVSIISYVLSAYTLTVFSVKIPRIIEFFKKLKRENRLISRWFSDTRLRVNVSLYASFVLNTLYSIFQLWLGFYHSSFWFYSMAGYYVSLAFMRFYLVRYSSKNLPGDKIGSELLRQRICAWLFLLVNLFVSVMIFFMVFWQRSFVHHEITTITIAAFTFSSLAISITGVIKYRKYNSPLYTTTKAINLASSCVSLLTLEATMLTTFGKDTDVATRKLLLAFTGAAVSLFILAMAIYIIVRSTKEIKTLNSELKNAKQ